jgi:hypothetical protein
MEKLRIVKTNELVNDYGTDFGREYIIYVPAGTSTVQYLIWLERQGLRPGGDLFNQTRITTVGPGADQLFR